MTHLDPAETPTQPRIIGLTGGIAMGKTTVSNYLSTQYQVPVWDADLLAREAVEPGSLVLKDIVERYGSGMLLPDGKLDRRRLGDIMFNSPPERLWLEHQIHPIVRERLEQSLKHPDIQTQKAVLLVIPLLFEARMTDLVTEIWVVACPEPQQIQRLMQRDRLTQAQAETRIKSQLPIDKKIQHADVVLQNSSTREALLQQIDAAMATPPKKQR